MSKPISIPNVYAAQSGPLPLSSLDVNFSTLASAINDTATYSNYFADTGAVNVMAVTTTGLTWSNTDGNTLLVKVGNTNTAGVTLNVNGSGALNVVNPDGSALFPGQLLVGSRVIVTCTGASFQLLTFQIPVITKATKPASTSRSLSPVLADDPDLIIGLAPSTKYDIEVYIPFYDAWSSGTHPGIVYRLGYTGSVNNYTAYTSGFINGVTFGSAPWTQVTNQFSQSVLSGSSLPDFGIIKASIFTNSAGNLSFMWSQFNNTSAATTVMQSAYIKASK